MANHKSAIKEHKKSVIREKNNRIVKTKVKTLIKKFDTALASGDFDSTTVVFRKTESEIMKACKKNVFKLNTAARKVSRLARKLKSIDPSYQAYLKTL